MLDLCTGSGCLALGLAHHLPRVDVLAVDLQPAAVALADRNRVRVGRDGLTVLALSSPRVSTSASSSLSLSSVTATPLPLSRPWWTVDPASPERQSIPSVAQLASPWRSAAQHRAAHVAEAPSTVTIAQGDIFSDDLLAAGPVDLIVSNPPYIDPALAPTLSPDVREYEDPVALFAPDRGLHVIRRLLALAPQMMASPRAAQDGRARSSAAPSLVVEFGGAAQVADVRSLLPPTATVHDDQYGVPRFFVV